MKRILLIGLLALSANAHTDRELFTLYTFTNWDYCFRVITMPYSWFVANHIGELEQNNVQAGALKGFWIVPEDSPQPCKAVN